MTKLLSKSNRFIRLIFCLFILSLIRPAGPVYPCWGSRPLSLGGAFTGVADDVNAVYWNPAGLAQWRQPGTTSMFAIDPDKTNYHVNYDLYLAGAIPIILQDLPTRKLTATLAMAYTYNKDPDYLYKAIDYKPSKDRREIRYRDLYNDFIHLSGGMFIYSDYTDVAVGLTLKSMTKGLTLEKWFYDKSLDKWSRVKRKEYSDREYDLDLGVLVRWGQEMGEERELAKMYSLGLLVQNVNQSKLLGTKHICNCRPGFGFRPHQNLLFSLELYDAGKEHFDKVQLRLGGELWFPHPLTKQKFIAFRSGLYHANNAALKARTFGLGIRWPTGYLRKGKAEKFLEIDYALMRWSKAKESTHLISLGLRF